MSIFKGLISPITELLKEVIPDTDKRAQLAHDIATMAAKHSHEVNLAQLEVNKKEAEHSSIFVSGWRPFVGWVCAVSLASNFLLVPWANALLAMADKTIVLPMVDLATMMPVLLGMLGLGTMRTTEKINKVARTKL